MDEEVKKIVDEAYKRTLQLMNDKKDQVQYTSDSCLIYILAATLWLPSSFRKSLSVTANLLILIGTSPLICVDHPSGWAAADEGDDHQRWCSDPHWEETLQTIGGRI